MGARYFNHEGQQAEHRKTIEKKLIETLRGLGMHFGPRRPGYRTLRRSSSPACDGPCPIDDLEEDEVKIRNPFIP